MWEGGQEREVMGFPDIKMRVVGLLSRHRCHGETLGGVDIYQQTQSKNAVFSPHTKGPAFSEWLYNCEIVVLSVV